MYDTPASLNPALYEEFTYRVAGCFVNDDRNAVEVSVHLRGWKHREWSRSEGQHKVYMYVQVRVDGRLAHELELAERKSAIPSLQPDAVYLNTLLLMHLRAGAVSMALEQADWLCRAVDEYLQAAARSQELQGRAA